LINVDAPDLIDGLLYCRHSSLRSRFQGPRVGFVGYGRCPVCRVTPSGGVWTIQTTPESLGYAAS